MIQRRLTHGTMAAILILGSLTVVGCKAKPAKEPSGFLPGGERMTEQRDIYPFHKVWFSSSWGQEAHKSVVIRPVNTEYVKAATWWTKSNLKRGSMDEDLQNLAVYTREQFVKGFSEDKNQRYKVVDTPGDDSLVFELALVEVVPNKASLGALGLAATVVAAPLGMGIAAKETAKGAVAIEGRVTEAKTGKVVAMFADREHGKFGPINLRRATWYGHAHKIIEEWSEQWVKIANIEPGKRVKDTRTFTLMPW